MINFQEHAEATLLSALLNLKNDEITKGEYEKYKSCKTCENMLDMSTPKSKDYLCFEHGFGIFVEEHDPTEWVCDSFRPSDLFHKQIKRAKGIKALKEEINFRRVVK